MKKDKVELAAELAVYHGVSPERIQIIGISNDIWQFIDYIVLPGEPDEASIAAEKRIKLKWEAFAKQMELGLDAIIPKLSK